ncbi:MAG: SPASM domain-containing protein [Elusimicrobia bacterium]|nr:SPASM domain-containing protein [Elusimicrobiota bacterium]
MSEKKTWKQQDANIIRLKAREGDLNELLARELGGRFSEYREKWDKAAGCVLPQDFPVHIDIERQFGCNLKCRTCIHDLPEEHVRSWGNTGQKLSDDIFRRVIDDGRTHNLYSVALNGPHCEPLLSRSVIDDIVYIKAANVVDIMITTNGHLLTEDLSYKLVESGLTRIMFSLDAFRKETYAKLRGGDLDSVVKKINRFLEIKQEMEKQLPVTRVSFVRNKINKDEVEQFADYWIDRVDYVGIQSFMNPCVGINPHYEEKEETLRLYDEEVSSGFRCAAPFRRMLIKGNGDALSCCNWYENIVGNVYRESVYDIWNGKNMQEIRSTVNGPVESQTLACRNCRVSIAPVKKKGDV